MNNKIDLLTTIFRGHPFHLGHKEVVDTAKKMGKKTLLLLGSAGRARTIRNPLTFEEREAMIRKVYPDADWLIIKPLYDKMYNDSAWIKQVQDIVKETALDIVNGGGFRNNGLDGYKFGLIGASKDKTSYYLNFFPQFESVNVPIVNGIHATNIRYGYLDGTFERYQLQDTLLPKAVCDFLFDEFVHTDAYRQLKAELEFVRAYKKQWAVGNPDWDDVAARAKNWKGSVEDLAKFLAELPKVPHPVKHVTCDAVVEQSAHVLLVKRRSEPGKGLWALPGGHVEEDEFIIDGAFRELDEETRIAVQEQILRGSILAKEVFDDPHRSTIGRVITHAYHIKLKNLAKLPKVKGSDDAEKAKWFPIADIKEDMMFDDHYYIIQKFLGVG